MNQNLLAQSIPAVMVALRATGLLDSLCTLKLPSGNQSPTGTPDGTYVPIAGLTNIPCMSPPRSMASPAPDVTRGPNESQTDEAHHVLLDNYYPAAGAAWLAGAIATIDGEDYILANVDHDSQFTQTRLAVKAVHL